MSLDVIRRHQMSCDIMRCHRMSWNKHIADPLKQSQGSVNLHRSLRPCPLPEVLPMSKWAERRIFGDSSREVHRSRILHESEGGKKRLRIFSMDILVPCKSLQFWNVRNSYQLDTICFVSVLTETAMMSWNKKQHSVFLCWTICQARCCSNFGFFSFGFVCKLCSALVNHLFPSSSHNFPNYNKMHKIS